MIEESSRRLELPGIALLKEEIQRLEGVSEYPSGEHSHSESRQGLPPVI